MNICPHCGTFKVERNGFCATYNMEERRAERQAIKDASKVKKPIPKRTPKRAAQEREYLKLNREYLECHPCCEVVECHRKSTQVHHMQTRTNENLLNVDLFLAVCGECHERITRDSKWALENGYTLPRATAII